MLPVETGWNEDRWIRAIEVQPGAREVVHHFILWRAAPGSEVQDAWIDAWAAGARPNEFPAGTARLCPRART